VSGPSLKKQDAHSSIHEASLNEAKELNELFRLCLQGKQNEKAFQVAEVLVEHWESRTLKHAEAEEEGLYIESVKENPALQHLVIQLTRDHDLMRRIVEQLKVKLSNNEMNESMSILMDSLVVIDSIHNEDEMNKLLNNTNDTN
jgi:uncharacterized protein with von Willebrand factor type A (vWA) domain